MGNNLYIKSTTNDINSEKGDKYFIVVLFKGDKIIL